MSDHAGHKIVKCSCGKIIMQCRCAFHGKPVEIVENGCDECKENKAKQAVLAASHQ